MQIYNLNSPKDKKLYCVLFPSTSGLTTPFGEGGTENIVRLFFMKKYTFKDLEKSPQTLIKFFLLQGKAEIKMLEDAYLFYITFSKKKNTLKQKNFTRKFIRAMGLFNSVKK